MPFRVVCEVGGGGRGWVRTPYAESLRKTGRELEGTERSRLLSPTGLFP